MPMDEVVTPAKAGAQAKISRPHGMPGFAFPSVTFAGMTVIANFIVPNQ